MVDDDRDDDKQRPAFRPEKTRLGMGPEIRRILEGQAGVTERPFPGPASVGDGPVTNRIERSPGATEVRLPAMGEGERYRIGALLGHGGMGEVLLATDEYIGREVAVKRIRATSPSAEELQRFVREACLQGRLEHPAVVPVHDLAIDADGKPFFVMKKLAGTDMHELLKRLRAGDERDEVGQRRRMLRAFADVCLAVEFAHSRGIIHRDLKPANIMLGDFGEVYVLDWGVAGTLHAEDDPVRPPSDQFVLPLESGETKVGTVLGTPAYMAPEQLAGDRAGPAADIYALGCILFEIVSGEPLHPRTRAIGQALTLADARPSQRRPDAPPELDAICLRATAIEAEERFPSARALGAAVQAYLDGNRDVTVRRELAQHHIADARAALAGGEDQEHRIAAMRAAGRALALDPTSTEAADLVTHIMLQPPREVPAEVESHLAQLETETARSQGRLAALSMLGYLAFVPFILWTGIHQPLYVLAIIVLVAIGGMHVFTLTRRETISTGAVYTNAAINGLLIAIVGRMVGPIIVAPTLAVTTLVAYASHPLFGRIRIVWLIIALSVLGPWVLELAGVLPPTYYYDAGKLVLSSPTITFSQAPTDIAFALMLVTFLSVVAILLRTVANRQRDATRQLELHAWHLRQIVPTSVR
ncbi:MAG TPA: protein kinase [Kofleriaceae bacterium]|nr:protein kinase [Kofleriaceae bacterium]